MQTNKMVALGTLVSGVAHEINNPISCLMLNLQTFDRFWQAVQPALENHFENFGGLDVGTMTYPQFKTRMPQLLLFPAKALKG